MAQWGNQETFGPNHWIEADKKYEVLSGRDGVIHAVRERKRMGSDFIKTTTTGGVLHGQGSKVETSLWRDEELSAMVSEVERLDMHIASHVHTPLGIDNAVKAGVHTIEHGTMISEETASLMATKGTWLIPTQLAGTFIDKVSPDKKKTFNPEIITKWENVSNQMVKSHKRAFELGVNIALGTDSPVGNDHGQSAKEISLMVNNIGMTPVQALQCATINAARAIRVDDMLGSIEPKKLADIVLVNGNPLEDISILESKNNIEKVIKNGKIMVEKGKITDN
jgi:imidazolonepropionase-like amidohydrolase